MKYAHRPKVQGSYAARTMRWGGVIILLFIVCHILDLTTGTVNPVGDTAAPVRERGRRLRPDRWYVTLFYIVADGRASASTCGTASGSAVQTLGQQTATRRAPAPEAIAAVLSRRAGRVGFLVGARRRH